MVVRETMVNAIVHREYGFSGSIIINVYSDRMEFISLGGLYGGISENDIMSGISQTRNEKLANVFYRLKHIEFYGYGIPKIFSDYKNYDIKPKIKATENAFVITIPNKNFVLDSIMEGKNFTPNKEYVKTTAKEANLTKPMITNTLKKYEKTVIEYIRSNGYITRDIVEKKLEIKQSRAYQIIREMQMEKLIVPSENDKRNFVLTDSSDV